MRDTGAKQADGIAYWVFGYGSLIWHPGFDYVARQRAELRGFHRSFCMKSIHHRGTPQAPGLVLALDAQAGARCVGVAFAVGEASAAATLAALRARELVSAAYQEARLDVQLEDGRIVEAVTYVVDRDHEQYAGALPRDMQARMIASATGGRGPNRDYLANTVAHLHDLGMPDPDLDWLAARVAEIAP